MATPKPVVAINDRGSMIDIIDDKLRDDVDSFKQDVNSFKQEVEDFKQDYDVAKQDLAEVKSDVQDIKDNPQIEFNTHQDFPAIGKSNTLYLATDENVIYRWDNDNLIYIAIAGSGSDFDTIQNFI